MFSGKEDYIHSSKTKSKHFARAGNNKVAHLLELTFCPLRSTA